MKNFSKTIASLSLSLLTVGAFAQAKLHVPVQTKHGHALPLSMAKQMPVLHQVPNHTRKVTSGAAQLDLAYYNTDEGLVGSTSYAYWNPPGYCNMHYTAADSGAGANKNYNVNHAAIVAYDTLLDALDNAYSPMSGSVTVDTVYVNLGYRNTSGANDTMIFIIGAVGANGYPTGTVYTSDTVIVPPHSTALPGLYLDSIYEIYITPNFNIPSTAPGGYKFNVTCEVYGSKLDTLGPFYGSPYYTCGASDWASEGMVGPAMGALHNVNSFYSGFQFYNTAAYGGNGTVLTWPNAGGELYNSGGNFGDYWGITTCSNDTGYLYYQDIFMAVGISYTDVTGVPTIASNGLSVAQNYPNPFDQNTQINYTLTKSSNVTFSVYDMTGRVMINNVYTNASPGQHSINLSANTFSPGIYFYSFDVNGSKVTKKMVVTQ